MSARYLLTAAAALTLLACQDAGANRSDEAPKSPVANETVPADSMPADSAAQASKAADNGNDMKKQDTAMSDDGNAWTIMLHRYTVKDGSLVRFDYDALSKNPKHMTMLGTYVDTLAAKSPSSMGKDAALAYWANLYNALTVQVVAKNWPVDSIRDIGPNKLFGAKGPWDMKVVTVEGQSMSLNNIEHDTMRKNWKEPRIHYMVNCASVGCPNLMQKAWSAKTLEADLNAAAAAFINSERGVKVSGNKVDVSSIYHWYKDDFGGNDAGVLSHMRTYANGEKKTALKAATKVSGHDYNWSVNAGTAKPGKTSMERISEQEHEDVK
ncbi:DUF547 domain-containing protein [Robiginitomaculum antarcticum]|uniref:DUF547 domain-containing protein n=1 Tax=Robiginitomaculum antarcticum TaxID=437507 RepID=UPI000371F655|nr:DUF547 domain-containing protein [Robiginitomaculum antarcticum]